jgi:hypothetical protein
MKDAALIEWLNTQLAKFEQSLKAREQASLAWSGGTSRTWREAGCRMSKPQRLAVAEKEARIAAKCRHDVEMCKAAINAISDLAA